MAVNALPILLNSSWIAVELPMNVAAILRPRGGMSQTADFTTFSQLKIEEAKLIKLILSNLCCNLLKNIVIFLKSFIIAKLFYDQGLYVRGNSIITTIESQYVHFRHHDV